jgi:hypothetical protein
MFEKLFKNFGIFGKENKLIEQKVFGALIEQAPFPYFVVDDFLDSQDFKLVQENWPDPDFFYPSESHELQELPLTMQLGQPDLVKKMSRSHQKFWNYFFRVKLSAIISSNLVMFMNNISARYGTNLLKTEADSIMLMESQNQSIQMPIHSHYLMNPTNLFTILIYIDDGGRTDRGTALYGLDDVEEPNYNDIPRLAKNVVDVETAMVPGKKKLVHKKTIEFKENRVLSMIDSPYSFHGIGKCKLGKANEKRRVIRAHVRAPISLTSKIYNMSYDSFIARSKETKNSPSSTAWMHSDIKDHINNPPLGSVEQNKELAKNVQCPNFSNYR